MKIKVDSRKVEKGDTFIALRGIDNDGHNYINKAIENGASKIICEEGSYSVETIVVKDTREYLINYLNENYGDKINKLKIIGITGTNGKTTSAYLFHEILNKIGKKCGYIGTIGFYINEKIRSLNNTTPDIYDLYELLLECYDKNCEYVVMEVSSHALDKNRIFGLKFDEVAFTNLTQDHLDYHKTLKNYANAKRKLFEKTRGEKVAIINKDDPHHEKFMLNENKNITIGKTDADVLIKDYSLSHLHTKIEFSYENKVYNTQINMVGSYNVYNYLTALMLVNKLGFSIDSIIDITKDLMAPAGRMEMIKYNTNSVFVDYAHTPDAVINVLMSANQYKKGRIITIIGCGGDRDRTKRPIMGRVAEENSDYVIFTDDNPRTEDEKQIMNDIVTGLNKVNHEIIFDRKKAIIKGMNMLKDNDILMILGKGHEDYQIIGTEKHHFSDQEIVKNFIKEKNNA